MTKCWDCGNELPEDNKTYICDECEKTSSNDLAEAISNLTEQDLKECMEAILDGLKNMK